MTGTPCFFLNISSNNCQLLNRLCTATGVHYVTPIEFEALGGKERNWKRNIRLEESNKLVQFEIFEAGLVQTCPRSCTCQNCQTAKLHPTNLEKLIDTIYSPVKNGILPTPENSPEAEERSQASKIGNEEAPLSPIPVPRLNLGEEASSPSAAPLEKVSFLFVPLLTFHLFFAQFRSQTPLKELDITPASPVSVIFQINLSRMNL